MEKSESIESYLDQFNELIVVGGSSLCEDQFIGSNTISINGFRKSCTAAALNRNRSDYIRCKDFEVKLCPNPGKNYRAGLIIPENVYELPDNWPGRQPTTYFCLAMIVESLGIRSDFFGICGRATRHHYGDWEMWYMKHKMKYVKINDPRPRW